MTDPTRLSTTSMSLTVLDRVAAAERTTLRELVEETGLAKSTVHKHLETLRDDGLLRKKGEQYMLGFRLLSLGRIAVDSRDHYSVIEQTVRELGSTTDAAVDFTVEEQGQLVLVYEAVGGTNESTFGVGATFPLYNTAAGKAILATYPESRVDELLAAEPSIEWDERRRSEFRSELERVRDHGYAINDGECVSGYHSVASTIMGPDNAVIGAISLGGPTYHIHRSRLRDDLATRVREATGEISKSVTADNVRL